MIKANFLKTLIMDFLLFNRISSSIFKNFLRNRDGVAVVIYHLVCDKNYHTFLKTGRLAQLDVDLFKNQLTWLLDNNFSFITIDELSNMFHP